MPIPKRDIYDSAPKIAKSEKMTHSPGSIVGNRYQIIQKLGREKAGKTYLAKDLQAVGDARCAIEQLSPSYDNHLNWQLIEQHLSQEIDILQRLGDHSQIPQIHNHFIENKQFYIVREYINGDNLDKIVERKLFNEADAIALIQDALRILDFIHKTNIIHRNVQPRHLIRRKQDNSFVLINFGAIREIESTDINLKGEVIGGKSQGNWAYIAPEQKTGDSHFASDIYALGRSAIYALTGRSPLELEQTNIDWSTQCQISRKLQYIINKMVATDLKARYSSALDVLQDLRPLLQIKQVVGGRYAITHYLGGKQGVETYLADNLHRQYQSPCLVKQIELPTIHGVGKVKIERRFAEELAILERIGYHEQIPQLWDHFEENEQFYLVQAYIQGETLAEKIARRELSVSEIVTILGNTLSGLNFIHQNRIIHRNLKPSNLLIRYDDGQVIITDFGILRDIKTPPNVTVDSSQQEDKDNYWSPEQIAGRPTLSSDLYALGMTTIEALTNNKPSNFSRNPQTGELSWYTNLNLDRRLVKIINKMISLDLGERYQSTEKVLEELQRIPLGNKAHKSGWRSLPKIGRDTTPKSKWGLIAFGFLGILCLLGSIEFAFPTVRPAYYWYQGNKLLAETPQTALNVYTKAIDLKPESDRAWSGRGDALFSLKRYPEALEAYAEASRLNPGDWLNWQKQGDLLFELEQYQEAIARYDRALELEPNAGEIYNHRGKALYELQDYETALTMQEEATEIDRLNAEFLSDRAGNLIQLGRYYDALSILTRVQVIAPNNLKLWQNKALVLAALNRPQEANRVEGEIIDNYDQLLTDNPKNAELWQNRGDFLLSRQMTSKAIDSYQQAVALQPQSESGWLALGKALKESNQNQQALEALDQALSIRPTSYRTWQIKGWVYQNLDNLSEAIASYNRGLEINAEYAPLWRDKGFALNQQGNYSQAIQALSQASELAPKDFQTWLGLATAWNATGQERKALLAVDRAIELQPQDPEIWQQKANIYTQNAQYNEACALYRESLSVVSDSSLIMNSMRILGCRMN